MQILFPGWPLPRLGLPELGPTRTGWAESQEVSMGGHHPHEVTGAPAEREGEGRVSHCSTYQASEAPEEGGTGIYLPFRVGVCARHGQTL